MVEAASRHGKACRGYERVIDQRYLNQIRAEAKQFSNKLLSRRSGVARSAIMNFKKGRNTIKPRTLVKLAKAIHAPAKQEQEELKVKLIAPRDAGWHRRR